MCSCVVAGYLEKMTGAIMSSGDWHHVEGAGNQAFLQTVTKPVTELLVQVLLLS